MVVSEGEGSVWVLSSDITQVCVVHLRLRPWLRQAQLLSLGSRSPGKAVGNAKCPKMWGESPAGKPHPHSAWAPAASAVTANVIYGSSTFLLRHN